MNGNAAACSRRICDRGAGRFRPLLSLMSLRRLPAGRRPSDLHESGSRARIRKTILYTAEWFPRRRRRGRALVVLPQWNSGAGRARRLGQTAESVRDQRLTHDDGVPRRAKAGGVAARRLSRLEQRRPDDPRLPAVGHRHPRLIDWLVQQGYERIGILGTSLGSCVAFIATAHDPGSAPGSSIMFDVFLGRRLDRAVDTECTAGFEGM